MSEASDIDDTISKVQTDAGIPVKHRNLTNAGKGRKKGVPNRTTAELKEIISEFVGNNAEGAQELFDRVKAKSPARALALLVQFMEFVLPKQRHSEFTGSVTSISFNANEPIRDAVTAAEAYRAICGDPAFDFSRISFAAPEPTAAVATVFEPAAVQPIEAASGSATIDPPASAPAIADPFAEAVAVERAEAIKTWERLAE
jgi:hypothetical protein